jgi:hypothetical protein
MPVKSHEPKEYKKQLDTLQEIFTWYKAATAMNES